MLARLAQFSYKFLAELARFRLVQLEPKLVSARLAVLKLETSSSRLVSPIQSLTLARLGSSQPNFWLVPPLGEI